MVEKISYIIGFRQSNQERYEALVFVLSLLRKYFSELEIIVVEQDDTSKLELDEALNIKHLFIQNNGLYNCCNAFNLGAAQTEKKFLIFACSDVFLNKEDYLTLFESGNNFEAVTPHRTEMFNIVITDKTKHQFEVLEKRPLYTFAGGILLLTRSGFEKTGGWDERFEGWGGDDDAMSHVIFNKLVSKTFEMPFFHIDHPRMLVDGKGQPKYKSNHQLLEEILTMNGSALDRYTESLSKHKKVKKIAKQAKYVLAITSYNRPNYLKKMMSSFFETRNQKAHWEIIIADDNSSEETQDYLSFLEKEHKAIIIRNNRVGVHRQVNTILKRLTKMDFDLCFKGDDDVVFTRSGWDDLYWDSVQRNGYDHLIFYDTTWQSYVNLDRPIRHGGLISHCEPTSIQGGFYTLTKDIIETVGYFDEQLFGRMGLGHVDFSFRCCRAGFNVLKNPFDIEKSNLYLHLQSENYQGSSSLKHKSRFNPPSVIEFKEQLIQSERKYIPYNENFQVFKILDKPAKIKSSRFQFLKKLFNKSYYHKADSSFYPERGFVGFIGFLFRRFYNICIDLRLFFVPKIVKAVGRSLNKLGLDLMNIEQ